MTKEKYIIAGGNCTLLIEGIPYCPEYVANLLEVVEQVGFIFNKKTPELIMMGNELSINGTLAFASTLSPRGKLKTSGIGTLVSYTNREGFSTIRIPADFRRQGNLVIFQSIGYLISNANIQNLKGFLNEMCDKYQCLAFGKVEYYNDKIKPYVYVKKIGSLVQETACGSGSLAYSIIRDLKQITQPSGEIITIDKSLRDFSITAKVNQLK